MHAEFAAVAAVFWVCEPETSPAIHGSNEFSIFQTNTLLHFLNNIMNKGSFFVTYFWDF